MEGDYDTRQNFSENEEYTYPEGYDASSYADYYYQQQQEGGEDYDASYQQQGYEGYYSQQKAGKEGNDPYQYQYNYNTNVGSYDETQGQDYNYYNGDEEYGAEQQTWAETPETWSYSPEEGQQLYLDQLTTEQTSGYYYDEQGNLIDGYGGEESPTNVFNQEAYWESGQDSNDMWYSGYTSSPEIGENSPQDETDTEGLGLTDATPVDYETLATPEEKPKKKEKNGKVVSPSRKKKTKKERIEQRQAVLEKEEERLKAQEAAEAGENNNASGEGTTATKTSKLLKKKTGIVSREKAKFQLKLRIAKAIKRNRMPVQIRILPMTRKHLSPMDKYFGSKSVECVLSDIFWASMKGDIGRVKHLVEVEGESATDSKLDPWNLHQTPLHWAAKGGSVPVVNYLLASGANPSCVDENGSLPLHLSCWAGHVDASIVLLRASDAKDLYVQDYDGAMCPLDWANVRGHTKLLKAIEKYQDSLWLPKFVDDLIRGIVRYKIKIFKDPPKKPAKAAPNDTAADADVNPTAADPTSAETDKPVDELSPAKDTANSTIDFNERIAATNCQD